MTKHKTNPEIQRAAKLQFAVEALDLVTGFRHPKIAVLNTDDLRNLALLADEYHKPELAMVFRSELDARLNVAQT